MRRIIQQVLNPKSDLSFSVRKDLPLFIQVLQSHLLAGNDLIDGIHQAIATVPESATIKPLLHLLDPMAEPPKDAALPPTLVQLRKAILQSFKLGSPLTPVLKDIATEQMEAEEFRCETLTQLLPLKLIAPVFLCFLPSTFLVLGSIVISMMVST